MKRKTKIIIGIIIITIVGTAAFTLNYLTSIQRYQDTVTNITYNNIDASGIPDGTYTGECDVRYIYAKVTVAVEDGRITNINLLEHRNERGKTAESVITEIIAQQTIDVDSVSGATNSSKVIKKAIDNALSTAPEN